MRLSGDQIEIVYGTQRAIITTVGATLREYVVDGRAVIDGYGADEVSPGGRGQVLMPWPNRIADGRYEFAGQSQQLPIDETKLHHAIHGLVRWGEWRVEHRTAEHASFQHRLPARPGYPFPLDLTVGYWLTASGLSIAFRATNVGDFACPFGAGAHPYFAFSGARIDAVELCVPAAEWLEVDERSIPLARRRVEQSPFDFRRPRIIGTAKLDHAFTQLVRGTNGMAEIVLRREGDQLRLWLDRAFDFVQVFTGDTLPDTARRRYGVAVEPMTCAANAFNSGDGLRILQAGESFEGRWGVTGTFKS